MFLHSTQLNSLQFNRYLYQVRSQIHAHGVVSFVIIISASFFFVPGTHRLRFHLHSSLYTHIHFVPSQIDYKIPVLNTTHRTELLACLVGETVTSQQNTYIENKWGKNGFCRALLRVYQSGSLERFDVNFKGTL